jgi:CRISPR-associated endonuclease/helicase Cas3
MSDINFDTAFEALSGNQPFPWQRELYRRFISDSEDNIPPSCSIPTGLGKTRVIVIWLIALANGARVPRRLVYVVNRRTVVDQSTDEAKRVRDRLAAPDAHPEHAAQLHGLAVRLADLGGGHDRKEKADPVAVSTLRGQLAETREWWENPARPAVVVGTIDLIGSRLLFQGYRAGLNRRPLFAAFIGQDALLVHDEAHLEPAFQRLIEAVRCEQRRENSESMATRRLRVMALTATPRTDGAEAFELTDPEKNGEVPGVAVRLFAEKGVKTHKVAREKVTGEIARLALRHKDLAQPILVFVRTVQAVHEVRTALTNKKQGGVEPDHVQILTGTIRGRERDRLATEDQVFAKFVPEPKVKPKEGTVYLVCTSAGEVGVDLSAAHLVCDLTPLDSIAQRFGRVNRRGSGPRAEIDIVYESDPDPKLKDEGFEKARWATRDLFEDPQRLPVCSWDEGRRDASPAALGDLMRGLTEQERRAAFTPEPSILLTGDILFDSWALTTISRPLVDDQLPGRPPVAEYLHGVENEEQLDTQFAWRAEVEHARVLLEVSGAVRKDALKKLEKYLSAYPLKPQELLIGRTFHAVRHLKDFAKRAGDLPVWVVDVRGGIDVTTVAGLAEEWEARDLIDRTIVLPPAAGGLTRDGLLDSRAPFDESICYDVADVFGEAEQRPRVRFVRNANAEGEVSWSGPLGHGAKFTDEADDRIQGMTRLTPLVLEEGEDDSGRQLVAFVRSNGTDDDDSQSQFGRGLILLQTHLSDAEREAGRIAEALHLPPELRVPLIVAARFHDLGKDRAVWQRSVGNLQGSVAWAKSGRGGALFGLEGYRHEFGSLVDIRTRKDFTDLPPEQQDLVLHLIAAHHGRGRPHFPADEAAHPHNGPGAEKIACEVPHRFARLQRKYGRWGLAYLESLLRAADAEASANPSKTANGNGGAK